MDSIICKNQSTFVGTRHILDGVVIANEVVDYTKKRGGPCIILKVDF